MFRALVAVLAIAVALAAPAAALAQGAGSDQYQDPLAGQPGTSNPSGNNGGNGGSGGDGTANSTAATPGAGNGATTSAQARNQLPATGSDAWILALAGAALLGGGLGLRRVSGVRL